MDWERYGQCQSILTALLILSFYDRQNEVSLSKGTFQVLITPQACAKAFGITLSY